MPTFASEQEYAARRADVGFWRPYVVEALRRHGLMDAGQEPVAGTGSTYPTFLHGQVVVKFFGYRRWWSNGYRAERAAHALLATDPQIVAPRLLAEGQLDDDGRARWPYLITTRMSGDAWHEAGLLTQQRLSVAAALGEQVRRVHRLQPLGLEMHEGWQDLDVVAAARQSSLPPHLIAQIADFLARLGPFDLVFVNGDMIHRHVFVENGRLTGIIDWGDAIVTDRHYELAKLHLDTFDCDKALLQAFLAASAWPVDSDFAHKAMAHALYRQAYGLVQHVSMDVFYKVPALLPLPEIGTLDELAGELFAV